MDIVQVISQLGFPIAACVAMGWYVKYISDKHREDRKETESLHREAEMSIKEAIVNNTIVMTKICERMDMHEPTDNEGNAEP